MAKWIILPNLTQSELERFQGKIKRQTTTECWPWLGCKDISGYGLFKCRQKMYTSSRLMWFVYFRKDPEHLLVCHTCDNPSCCNPAHLFLGTNQDNQLDALRKGRLHPVKGDNHFSRKCPEKVARGARAGRNSKPESFEHHKGETHYAAKLRENDVIRIRTLYSEGLHTMAEIGQSYEISPTTVHAIVHRKRWKHI